MTTDTRFCAITSDAGVGKTRAILKHIEALQIHHKCKFEVLFVSTINVVEHALEVEIKKYSDFSYYCLRNKGFTDADIFGTNPEYLKTELGMDFLECFLKGSAKKILVLDESAKYFRTHTSQNFKLIKQIIKYFFARFIMTATITANNIASVWSQFYLMDEGKTFGDNFYKFRERYFYCVNVDFSIWKLKAGAKDEIMNKMSKVCYSEKISDDLLPLLIENKTYYEADKSTFNQYKELEKDGAFEDDKGHGAIASSQPKQREMKRQFASGFVYLDKGLIKEQGFSNKIKQIIGKVNNAKLQLIDPIIARHRKKIIITYYYQIEKDLICAYLEDRNIRFSTDLSIWMGNKPIQVYLVQVKRIAHGINIQHLCNVIINYTLIDDFEVFYQLKKRIYRRGSASDKAYIYHLLSPFKIDNEMFNKLIEKEEDLKKCQSRK